MKTINKEQMILTVAAQLLKANGQTTNLEIKLECRNKYSGNFFTQEEVSKVMDEEFRTNSHGLNIDFNSLTAQIQGYRTYVNTTFRNGFIVAHMLQTPSGQQKPTSTVTPQPKSNNQNAIQIPKVYNITDDDGCKITGTRKQLELTITKLNLDWHYSETSDRFDNLKTVDVVHLQRIISKGLAKAHTSGSSAARDYCLSSEMKAFVARYSEFVAWANKPVV